MHAWVTAVRTRLRWGALLFLCLLAGASVRPGVGHSAGTASSDRALVFDCVFDDDAPRWQEQQRGFIPRTGDLPLLDCANMPRLPYRDVMVLLPPDHRAVTATGTVLRSVSAPPPGEVAHASATLDPEGLPLEAAKIGTELAFPEERVELLGTTVWHGYAVAHVRLYPLRLWRDRPDADWSHGEWTPLLRLAVESVPTPRATRRQRPVPGEDATVRERLTRDVLNPGHLALYPVPAATTGEAVGGFLPTWAPSLDGSDVEMVIITGESLASEFTRLAAHRTSHGVPAVVRTVTEILAGYPRGADVPATLRRFLIDAYELWGTRHVLLGGDVDIVPTRKILNTLYPVGTGTELPVDLYFGCLDGDWNADGDECLGEPFVSVANPGDAADLVAELTVGRLPARSLSDAAVLVDKIIAYEQGVGGPRHGRMLFLSEVLFPSDYVPGGPIVEDGASYSENVIDTVIALAPTPPLPVRLYEAAPMWPGAYPETRAAVIDSLNSGAYGLVNHIGHGFFYNMSVGSESFDLGDAGRLHNGANTFLLTSLNCSSSAFDYNCILERLLLNAGGGAVATIGSARGAFPVAVASYQAEFFRALFVQGVGTVGEALIASRAPFDHLTGTNSVQRWTHMTTTLLGDPAMLVRTAPPQPLTVQAPSGLVYGPQQVVVAVSRSGSPVSGATVCLQQIGHDYARAITSSDGTAVLAVTVKSGQPVDLRVTATNAPPYAGTLSVSAQPQPYLRAGGLVWHDDGSYGSLGNGDGVPNSGETLALIVTFTNSGDLMSGSGATALLSGNAPGLTLLGATVPVPALTPGQSVTVATPFMLAIDSWVPNGGRFDLGLTVQDGGRIYSDEIPLETLAPEVRPSVLSWSDHPGGDGDGVIEPGEVISLQMTLINLGGGAAADLTGWLESESPQMTVVDGVGSWPDIAYLGEQASHDGFAVQLQSVSGSIRGRIHVQDGYGHVWSHRFDLVNPAQAQILDVTAVSASEVLLRWQPSPDADLYGYHVYRSLVPNGGFERLTTLPISGGCFYRDSGLAPMTRYFYSIAAVDSSCLVGRLALTAVISTAPSEQLGFPIDLPAETSSHCAVGDVDGDGRQEIVLAADYVYVWDREGVELRDGDGNDQTHGPFNDLAGNWGPAGVTLADLTPHPGLEIVVSHRTTLSIYVYQGDGSVAPGWPRTMSAWNWTAPVAGDLDGDGDLEVATNTIDGRTYAWHHDGTEVADGDNNPATHGVLHVRPGESYNFSTPALADLDGLPGLELIFGTRHYDGTVERVHALRHSGQDVAGWPYVMTAAADVLSSPAVGDLDGDGVLEIVFVTEDDRLHVVGANGLPRAPFPVVFTANNAAAGISCPSPALADFDGDGTLEIVAVAVSGATTAHVHVLNLSGSNLPGWPRSVAGNSESSPVVGDITGEGTPAVLFGVGGGSDSAPNALYAFRANGGAVPGFPITLAGPVRPAPTLTDLDGDGDIDIVYGGWDLRMHVWDLPAPYAAERVPWPTFHGDVQRTGRYRSALLTDVPPPALLSVASRLDRAWPNPCNPRARISFAVSSGVRGPVRLSLYDLRGRLITRLVDTELPAGEHQVDWSGTDAAGRPVASGVYFYRLEAAGQTQQRKLMLAR